MGSGGDGTIRILDVLGRRIVAERNLGHSIISQLALTPDGRGLYASLGATNFVLLDASTLAEHFNFIGHTQQVCGLALDRSGSKLVSAAGDLSSQGDDNEMFLWDAASRRIRFQFPRAGAAPEPRFSESGRYLSRAICKAGVVEIWDMEECRRLSEFKAHHGLVYTAAFAPDEEKVATCGEDGFIRVWDWRKREEIATLGRHNGPARNVQFSPVGNRLVSCGLDSTIRVWDLSNYTEQVNFRGHRGRVHEVVFSPDGRWIVSGGGADQSLRFWDATLREAETRLDRAVESLVKIDFTPGGKEVCLLRTREEDSLLKVWSGESLNGPSPFTPSRSASADEPILFTVINSDLALVVREDKEIIIFRNRAQAANGLVCAVRSR